MLATVILATLLLATPPARGYTVSVDARGIAVDDLARLLTVSKGFSVRIDNDARMRVSLTIRNTPWDLALYQVLTANGLGSEVKGRTMRIARQETLDREREQRVRDQSCRYVD